MKILIEQLNRTVELEDDLVRAYLEYSEIREYNLIIMLVSKYGHLPAEEEISDEELSRLFTEVLTDELKLYMDLPRILKTVMEYREEFIAASKAGTLLEIPIPREDEENDS